MKNLFKFKKCNKELRWLVYSDGFLERILSKHPMVAGTLINSHIDCINQGDGKKCRLHFEQVKAVHEAVSSKYMELAKDKTLHQHYAYTMVRQKGLFAVVLSTDIEERLEFLDWYFNLIFPLK